MTNGTDIIAGVARAADPVRQREVILRLERMSRESAASVAAQEQAANSESDWSTQVRLAAADTTRNARFVSSTNAAGGSPQKADVYVQFEALLLQNMIEAMLPEDAEAVFGSGTAGKVWKSMLAEKVAEEIARTGSLGIAKQIAAGPSTSSGVPTPPSSNGNDT
jgi:hypothetical protein